MSLESPTTKRPGLLRRALLERLVERLATGRLPGFLARFTHRRLESDLSLARYYDSLRRVQRAAAGHPAVSDAQRELLRSLLFDSTDLAGGEAKTLASSTWPRVGVALAGATAAALLFVQLSSNGHVVDNEPAWTARSFSEPSIGVRARCLSEARDTVVAEAEAGVGPTVAPPELSCSRQGLLALSATNRGDVDLHVFVIGLSADGELHWIAPFDRGASSVAIEKGGVDVLLGDLAALSASSAEDRVALHALFARAPFAGRDVEAALSGAERQGLDLGKVARVPLIGTAQARVDLVLRGGEEGP